MGDQSACGAGVSLVGLYGSKEAITRAILGRAVQLARIERLATMGASVGTAGVTHLRAWRPGPELRSTLAASLGLSDDGQAAIPHRIGVFSVKGLLRYTVADVAERGQVVEMVGLLVGLEQVKRLFVMHREIITRAAMLAGVAVSLKRLFSLVIPIRATRVTMPTLPSVAIGTDKAPFSPFCVALPITEIVIGNLARLQLKRCATLGALNRGALLAYADPVFSLPKAIAVFITEMMLGQVFSVSPGLELLPALVTR